MTAQPYSATLLDCSLNWQLDPFELPRRAPGQRNLQRLLDPAAAEPRANLPTPRHHLVNVVVQDHAKALAVEVAERLARSFRKSVADCIEMPAPFRATISSAPAATSEESPM